MHQVVAVLQPVAKEELHADAVLLLRHALFHVIWEQVIIDGEEVEGIILWDEIYVDLREDVGVPQIAQVVLGVSNQVTFKLVVLLRRMNAFELDKVAAAASVLLIDGEGLDFVIVTITELYVTEACFLIERQVLSIHLRILSLLQIVKDDLLAVLDHRLR